jgi:hypothetical protein
MNWAEYNDSLVRRGRIFIDLLFLKSYKVEGVKKRGRPFVYPDSLIELYAALKYLFHLPYRQLEGVIQGLSEYVKPIPTPDYTTLDRRINRLGLSFDDKLVNSMDPVDIAIDSSGIKVHKSGGWITRKYGKKKKYVKIHLAVNVKTREVVSMSVTTDEVHDSKEAKKLIDDASRKYDVKKAYMDGAYDSREIFRYLEARGIIPVIKVRRNSVLDGGVRDKYVVMQLLHYDKWREKSGYGYRWIVETVFSVFKRIFGEYVSAKKFENIVNEIILKMRIYNLLSRMTNIA